MSDSPEEANEASKPLLQQIEKTRTRQKSYKMDLKIHSPASLGYFGVEGLDTAPALVRLAKVKGLDMIAITDSFSGEYIDRIVEAAKGSTVMVIPGVEIRCVLGDCDDVILSCLFPEQTNSEGVRKFLRALEIPESAAGKTDYVVKTSFEKILETIESMNGVALPSRMDKTPHRMQVIPALVDTYGFRAFDLAYADSGRFFKKRWPKIKFNLFSFSDARALAQVGSRSARVKMPQPGFTGIRDLATRESAR